MPRVVDKDEVDLSDIDNFSKLSHFEQMLVLLDQVRAEHGPLSMDTICTAELQMMWWAIVRRRRLESIHSARSMKRDHRLENSGEESLARRGVKDVNAARQWFAKCGLPIIEAVQ